MFVKLILKFIIFFISLYFLIEYIIETEHIDTLLSIKLFVIIFCLTIILILYNNKDLLR